MPEDLVTSHEEFYFAAPYTRNIEIRLLLENHSTQPIAFKVKITDPRRYTVKPTSGVIASESSKTVIVTFQGFSNEARVPGFLKTKQKFLLQYRLLEGNADTNLSVASLMNMAEVGGPVQEKKIACRFDTENSLNDQEGTLRRGDDGQQSPTTPNGPTSGPQPGQAGCCISRRCLVYLLVALLVLLVAIALGYMFRDQMPSV